MGVRSKVSVGAPRVVCPSLRRGEELVGRWITGESEGVEEPATRRESAGRISSDMPVSRASGCRGRVTACAYDPRSSDGTGLASLKRIRPR